MLFLPFDSMMRAQVVYRGVVPGMGGGVSAGGVPASRLALVDGSCAAVASGDGVALVAWAWGEGPAGARGGEGAAKRSGGAAQGAAAFGVVRAWRLATLQREVQSVAAATAPGEGALALRCRR